MKAVGSNGVPPRPTIYDVARTAGVSKSLVSLVLRGAGGVSAASREAVNRAIRELGYRPSRAASDLAAKSTRIVGVLIDDYSNPWFVDLLRGLDQVLSVDGYRLSVADTATAARVEDPVEGLLSMRADGIVVARDVPQVLLGENVPPFVIAGTRTNVPEGVDAVGNDDEKGARLATDHLLALGHRVIGHLAVVGGAGDARRDSFETTMRDAGARAILTPDRGPASERAGFGSAIVLLAEHPEVTAVFAANDVMAIGALGAARELGLDVPGDLSIIGYDNTALARTRLIDLTTVDDDSIGVGRETGKLLLARMAGKEPVGVRRTLEPSLVVRGTTAERL
ncbi:LacI family transcriptional regulator [Microbacterium profundi]|uniref:LacI family DNA-binding transcriptional regulator n=1 Tax=Microbacterium profundi TaxID=450380 RepID=UPI001F214B45|nr:LacI family DNA-binding transcriptional regulator [Microbacterium profundi]MCE7481222.1 LacI family transcriptional regulator [Microbacterium profundi]